MEAENANGTADPKSWTWTVGTTGVPVTVDPSEGTVEVAQGGSKTFYVNSTNGQNIKVDWLVNDVSTKTEDRCNFLFIRI